MRPNATHIKLVPLAPGQEGLAPLLFRRLPFQRGREEGNHGSFQRVRLVIDLRIRIHVPLVIYATRSRNKTSAIDASTYLDKAEAIVPPLVLQDRRDEGLGVFL